MHIYRLAPIDFWGGWLDPQDVIADGTGEHFGDKFDRNTYEQFFARAQAVAKQAGWEGDMRLGPFISALPDITNTGAAFLIGWKQDNNGTTFIASPVRLPYLEQAALAAVQD